MSYQNYELNASGYFFDKYFGIIHVRECEHNVLTFINPIYMFIVNIALCFA